MGGEDGVFKEPGMAEHKERLVAVEACVQTLREALVDGRGQGVPWKLEMQKMDKRLTVNAASN